MSFGLKTSFGRYVKNKTVHLYGIRMTRYDIATGKAPVEYFKLISEYLDLNMVPYKLVDEVYIKPDAYIVKGFVRPLSWILLKDESAKLII